MTQNKPYHRYTEEERAWLRENLENFRSYAEMAAAFNRRFGMEATANSLTKQCKALALHKVNQGRISKGARNTVKPGAAVGAERVRMGKNGRPYIWVKVVDEIRKRGDDKGSYNKFWQAKHRLIWEHAHGPLKKWDVVIFLNNDTLDCRLENLYKTTNQINMMMTKFGWYNTDPELTLTALKWCELRVVLLEGTQI